MSEPTEPTDVQIARLQEGLKNLREKVDESSGTILRELKDLKDNIITRLERVETTKLAASDFVTYKGEQAEEIKKMVTSDEFDPVRKIAYGLVATMLTSVIVQVLALIYK